MKLSGTDRLRPPTRLWYNDLVQSRRLRSNSSLRAILMVAVECTTYYLEMFAPPKRDSQSPRDGLAIEHIQTPSAQYYRSLYDVVGNDYNWRSRRKMTEEQLLSIIGDPRDELHVLFVDRQPAGFAELDRRQPDDEIELVQFGLIPEFIGQGLGKWFLQSMVEKAWSYNPKRFWVHTCTLDHPAAVPNYLKAGFKIYNQETCMRVLG